MSNSTPSTTREEIPSVDRSIFIECLKQRSPEMAQLLKQSEITLDGDRLRVAVFNSKLVRPHLGLIAEAAKDCWERPISVEMVAKSGFDDPEYQKLKEKIFAKIERERNGHRPSDGVPAVQQPQITTDTAIKTWRHHVGLLMNKALDVPDKDRPDVARYKDETLIDAVLKEAREMLAAQEKPVWPLPDRWSDTEVEEELDKLATGAIKAFRDQWLPTTTGAGRAIEVIDRRPALLTFADSQHLSSEMADRQHIVQDLLTAQDIAGLAAKKGVGKSTLLRTLAVHVSKGWNFLGLKTNPCRVWYIDLEPGNHQARHDAFERLGWDENDRNLVITTAPPVAGQAWAFEWLEENIVKEEFGLVIIDTLFKFCKIDQANDYSSGLYGSAPLEGVIKRTKACIKVSHHSQKNANPNNPNASAADLFLGAVSIAGSFGVCMAIRRRKGGNTRFKQSIFMDPPRYTKQVIEDEWLLVRDPATGRVELGELVYQDWWRQAKEAVLSLAKQINQDFKVSDLLERSDDFKRKELKRLLNGLIDDGDVVVRGQEKSKGAPVVYGLAGTAPSTPQGS